MIHAHQQKDGSFIVIMDAVDHVAISRLADSYSISNEDMLIGLVNKGIDVIGKQVQQSTEHDKHEDGYNGTD